VAPAATAVCFRKRRRSSSSTIGKSLHARCEGSSLSRRRSPPG